MKINLDVLRFNKAIFVDLLTKDDYKLWVWDMASREWVLYDDNMRTFEISGKDILTASKDKPTKDPLFGINTTKLMFPKPLTDWPTDQRTVYIVTLTKVVEVPYKDRGNYKSYIDLGRVHDTKEAADKHCDALQYVTSIQDW